VNKPDDGFGIEVETCTAANKINMFTNKVGPNAQNVFLFSPWPGDRLSLRVPGISGIAPTNTETVP
jgi:hypothetical protein